MVEMAGSYHANYHAAGRVVPKSLRGMGLSAARDIDVVSTDGREIEVAPAEVLVESDAGFPQWSSGTRSTSLGAMCLRTR